jgi:hypothetical protein
LGHIFGQFFHNLIWSPCPQVYDMLNRLTSADGDVSEAAKTEIDVYLENRQRRQKVCMYEYREVATNKQNAGIFLFEYF